MDRILADVRFRLATPADAGTIADMSCRLIEAGLGWSWTRQRVEHAIRNAQMLAVAAVHDGEIIGFGIMEFGDETAHLSLFAVGESFQRKGVGVRMFAWLRTSALTAGIALVRLELRASNAGARAFYRMLGFMEAGQAVGYYRGIENAMRMTLDLRKAALG